MVDFVGFGTGYNKQQNSDERRRLELAKAFSEFKQANPYSTPMEMQSFIDQAAAGRNYLAGGMPSGDVLNIIGERNAAALKAKKDKEAMAAQTSKLNIFNTQLGMKDSLAGSFTGDIYSENAAGDQTLSEAYKTYLKDIETQTGQDFTEILTPDAIRKNRENRTVGLIPKVIDYIRTTDGTVSAEDAAKAMGVPTYLVSGVVERVKAKITRENNDYLYGRKKDILGEIERVMLRGGDVEETLNAFKTNLTAFGVNEAEVNKAVAEMKVEAKRIEDKIKKDREYELNQRQGTQMRSFASDVIKVPAVATAIYRGEIEVAKEFMEEFLLTNYPEMETSTINIIKTQFDSIIKGFTSQSQFEQDNLHNEKKGEADKLVSAVPAAMLKRSQDAAFSFFSGKSGSIKVGTSGDFAAAPEVANALAGRFDLSNQYTLALLSDYFRSLGKEASYNEGLAGATQLLENSRGVTTLKDATITQQDQTRKNVGDFDGDQTFDNWFTGEKSAYEKKFEEGKSAYQDALTEQDIATRIRKLRGVAAGLNMLSKQTVQNFAIAYRYGQGKSRWITAGTPGFDKNATDQFIDGTMQTKEALMKEINQAIATAQQQQQTQPSGPTFDNISNQRKKTRRNSIGNVVSNMQSGAAREMVDDFLGVSNLKSDLVNKVIENQYQNFTADPVSFIRMYYNTFYSDWINRNNNGNNL